MQSFKCKSGLAIGILGALVMGLSVFLLFPGWTKLAITALVAGFLLLVGGLWRSAKNYVVKSDEMKDV